MLGRSTLLINPPLINGVAFTRQGRCQEREDVLGTTKPPYTLALAASLLREAGCDVRLIDATAERLSDRRRHRAARSGPVRADAHRLSDDHADARCRRCGDRAAEAAVRRTDLLLRAARVDGASVVNGARSGSRRHVRRRAGGRDPPARAARIGRPRWRRRQPDVAQRVGAVVPHRAHGSFSRFSTIPYPAWDLVALDRYALPLVNKRYVIVETSRGCPYTCDFCVAPIHQGHKFRERSAKSLVDEIERTHRELGVDFFYLWGDTVTLNVKSFTAFCDELIARKLPIQWFGNARADNLTDPAFVHRLKQSGCWMLALGIESESDEVRKDMVKRLERQKIQAAFQNMRDAGIRSFAFFIFGYPGETPQTMEQTIKYAIALDPDFANFYPAVPYPGTALYEKCIRDSLLPPEAGNDWSKMEYSYYLLRGNGLDDRIVMDAINRAKRRFFLRPGYLARHVGDVAQIALSKQNIVWQVLSRTLFGAPVVDTSTAAPGQSAAAQS